MERAPICKDLAPQAEVDRFVNTHFDAYVSRLQIATFEAAKSGREVATVVTPQRSLSLDAVEREGKDIILRKLIEHFRPLYPDRTLTRSYHTKFDGKHIKDVDSKAEAFEVIWHFVPGY